MRRLALIAFLLAAAPLAACGSEHQHRTTIIAEPGSTVVAPDGAKIVKEQ